MNTGNRQGNRTPWYRRMSQALIVLMLVPAVWIVLSSPGCQRIPDRPPRAQLNEAGELEMCGQRYAIDARTTRLLGNVQNALLVVDAASLLGADLASVFRDRLITLQCDKRGWRWTNWGPQVEAWLAIIDRPALGLREHRQEPAYTGGPQQLLFSALDEDYRKPDGSPFVIECTAYEDWQPQGCSVEYLYGRMHVSYGLDGKVHLPHWRALDAAIRQYLGHP